MKAISVALIHFFWSSTIIYSVTMTIIAVVDTSNSTQLVHHYEKRINVVLATFPPPVRVLQWNSEIVQDKLYQSNPVCHISNHRKGTEPKNFLQQLMLSNKEPFELHIFTDGMVTNMHLDECLLPSYALPISKVNFYFFGKKKLINMRWTALFPGIEQYVYVNQYFLGHIPATPLSFDTIDFNFITEDDSLILNIFHQIHSGYVDKETMKEYLQALSTRILTNHFVTPDSIRPFYEAQDIDACIDYVQKSTADSEKTHFQRKIRRVLNLLNKPISNYSMMDIHKQKRKAGVSNTGTTIDKPDIQHTRCIDNSLLYLIPDLTCIPVVLDSRASQSNNDDNSSSNDNNNNNSLQNSSDPFQFLASPTLVNRLAQRILEPIQYQNYCDLQNNNNNNDDDEDASSQLSPAPPFLLHHKDLDIQTLLQHNQRVLGMLFQKRALPGHRPVLWHMIFLYVTATERYPEHRERLFAEIRFLGTQAQFVISLTPTLNPPIVESLNCCLWYAACVCARAFPNSPENILRHEKYISGTLLTFYKEVYNPPRDEDTSPPFMARWQLWATLRSDSKIIFQILSHYVQHEIVPGESPFSTILFRKKLVERYPTGPFPRGLEFISKLTINEVMGVYRKMVQGSKYKVLENLENLPDNDAFINLLWNDDDVKEEEEEEDKLSHVKINPLTCHPFVYCPTSDVHWKECIQTYDVQKQSYLRLFKRYCDKYNKYPRTSEELMHFLNEYLFRVNGKVPEFFPLSLKQKMAKVLTVFKRTMMEYKCGKYIIENNKNNDEKDRMLLDTKYYENNKHKLDEVIFILEKTKDMILTQKQNVK